MAGIEGKQVVLLLEDHQFVDQQFLELVNSLLSAGEVPGLYTHEELEPLLAPIKDEASEVGFRGSIVQYYASSSYFSCIQQLFADTCFLLVFSISFVVIVRSHPSLVAQVRIRANQIS